MDSYQKRDLHSEAKKAGFKPVYSMKHPSIKVLMQRSSSRKIETDKFKTTTIDIEHFWFMCRHLLWKNDLLTLKINEVSALRVSQKNLKIEQ